MTRQEAFKRLEQLYDFYANAMDAYKNHSLVEDAEAIKVALWMMTLKRSERITREQVEKMRGEWKSYLNGDYNDEVYYCGVCGCEPDSTDRAQNFCSECGAPMTEEAVDILWHRLEEMQDEQTD